METKKVKKAAKPKARTPREDRKVVHTTKVKIDLIVAREILTQLREAFLAISPNAERVTKEQRSAFHKWNTVRSFLSSYDNGEDFTIIETSGGTAGSSLRIYYFPSITSNCKEFRRCIVPITPGNKFMFFDLKAAEFVMNCIFCNEAIALAAYHRGDDIYLHYESIFPKGTPRKVIKEAAIANMYGVSAYRVALNAGISENAAENIIRTIQRSIPSMEMNKLRVIHMARNAGAYLCPNGFDQNNLVEVAKVNPGEEFKPLLALSAYVQSALGVWMKGFLANLEPRCKGTLLSVFDSVLFEIKPDNAERAEAWVRKTIYPFRAGTMAIGDNFLEAYQGESAEH